MSARTRAIQSVLAAEADTDWGWNQLPVLYRLHVLDGSPHLVNLGIARHVWTSGDVQAVLTGIALLMEAGRFMPVPDDPAGELVGMAVRTEGWWVESHPDRDPRGHERMNKMSGEGRLYQHPDRVEVRMVTAVDRHGVTYQVRHVRDGETEQLMMLPGREDLQLTGAVIEALDVMVHALTGAKPPPRPPSYAQSTEGLN